jgi:hypothetical protein
LFWSTVNNKPFSKSPDKGKGQKSMLESFIEPGQQVRIRGEKYGDLVLLF